MIGIGIETIIILCKSIILFIYGIIAFISMIFTFNIDAYMHLDEVLNIDLLLQDIMTPIDRDIARIDDWLIYHNKIIGPLLIILSLIDIVMLFRLIDLLS